jgi:hypothetical protein
MIHFPPRATPGTLAGILLAATTAVVQIAAAHFIGGRQAVAQSPVAQSPVAQGPAIQRQAPRPPTQPPVPMLEGPVVPGPAVESFPAQESDSPFADALRPPSPPRIPAGPIDGQDAADAPYGYDPSHDYAPRLPGRIRSHFENRPRQQPLQSESWLNRPFSASFFLGGVFLDDPLDDPLAGIAGDAGFYYGGRFGWDFAPRFGMEGRIGAGSAGTSSTVFRVDLPQANLFYTDINWLWYPTGDTRWRPYVMAGTGLFNLDFIDIFNHRYHETMFEIPLGIGLKYRYSTRTVMRFEFVDNFALGTGLLEDMHNFSFSAGLETRFGGGNRKNYWPWKPDRDWR